jgi:hypothetical protein
MEGEKEVAEFGPARLSAEPRAASGCGPCLSISTRRLNARSRGDYSAVSDANVELRRHQADAHHS